MSAVQPKRPILVVDDEPEMLYSLRGLLRQDFEVYCAASGPDAIQILQQHVIHVVMTDQRMPQMTGVEFLRRIKCDYPEAIRLIFTGYADIQAIVDAINQGNVFRYISKPWNPEELVAAIQEAGVQYDRIVARRELLADARRHEQQCLGFEERLEAVRGSLPPDAAAELTQLYNAGRTLVNRLGQALEENIATLSS